MTREEHLQWAKGRAIEYTDSGDTNEAFASFQSDMRKHNETKDHLALDIMTRMFFGGLLSTPLEMKRFIEGFN